MDAIAAVTSAEAAATSAGAASTSAQTVGQLARAEHQAQCMPWFRCNFMAARLGMHRDVQYTPVRVASTASTAPGAATASTAPAPVPHTPEADTAPAPVPHTVAPSSSSD